MRFLNSFSTLVCSQAKCHNIRYCLPLTLKPHNHSTCSKQLQGCSEFSVELWCSPTELMRADMPPRLLVCAPGVHRRWHAGQMRKERCQFLEVSRDPKSKYNEPYLIIEEIAEIESCRGISWIDLQCLAKDGQRQKNDRSLRTTKRGIASPVLANQLKLRTDRSSPLLPSSWHVGQKLARSPGLSIIKGLQGNHSAEAAYLSKITLRYQRTFLL